ncbi:MAG: hypothetical protein JWO49_111 [Arthrobacter sp.]|nr:hypothetical protein [Arthrobacter sp.]
MKIKAPTAATLITLLLLGGLLQVASSPVPAAGTAYYLSDAGSDNNVGTSADSPWKSLAKINSTRLKPGDSVSFRRGDTWTGGVVVNRSGTARSAITLKSYGSGSLPTILVGQSGNCVRLNGNFITVDGLRAEGCGYAGFGVYGDNGVVKNSTAVDNAAGIQVGKGSDFGKYLNNTLADNNIMNVNTPGVSCETPDAVNCSDDSGAFGVLINGNDNEFSGNTITGSTATSYDFSHDGAAIEIYNGNRNRIHHNVAIDNNVFSELGRSDGTADGNTFSYNLIRASCGAKCSQATGLIARGPASSFGPTNGTIFEHNTVWLNGSESQAVVCHASCPRSSVIRGNILVAVRHSLWMDGSGWTEEQNVLNGPTNVAPDGTSTTAPAAFVNAPADLHLKSTSPAIDRVATSSPAIDRAGMSPFSGDLAGGQVPENGDCKGTSAADAGAYEYKPRNC